MDHSAANAQFTARPAQNADADPTVLQLITLRSDDPVDTTVHSTDRFRTIWDTRRLLLMHPWDMLARGLVEGDMTRVTTVSTGEPLRELAGMRVVPCDLPRGSVGGYFPECNPLLADQRHSQPSQLHAPRSISVRVRSASA